jgi:hypothetical protein
VGGWLFVRIADINCRIWNGNIHEHGVVLWAKVDNGFLVISVEYNMVVWLLAKASPPRDWARRRAKNFW